MVLNEKQIYSEDLLFDLNTFFGKIGISKYRNLDDVHFEREGFDIEILRNLLDDPKRPYLNYISDYLIFAGYTFKQMKEGEVESSAFHLTEKVRNAKILHSLRTYPSGKIKIDYILYGVSHRIRNNKEIELAIRDYYERMLAKSYDDQSGTIEKLSDEELLNFIEREERLALRTGAPYQVRRIAKFAELLLYFMHYNNEVMPASPYTLERFTNKECALVHDYLLFWKLIGNRLIKLNGKTHDTRANYIRSMVVNLRTQRKKWERDNKDSKERF